MPVNANKAREIFIELVGQVPPEQWDSRLAELRPPAAEPMNHAAEIFRAVGLAVKTGG